MDGDETKLAKLAGDDLVAYFRALPADAREAFAALATLDRTFGEDVAAERAKAQEPR